MNLHKMCVYTWIYFNKEKNNESLWTNSLKKYILVKIELTWKSKENQINKKSLIFNPLFPHCEVSTKTPKLKKSIWSKKESVLGHYKFRYQTIGKREKIAHFILKRVFRHLKAIISFVHENSELIEVQQLAHGHSTNQLQNLVTSSQFHDCFARYQY